VVYTGGGDEVRKVSASEYCSFGKATFLLSLQTINTTISLVSAVQTNAVRTESLEPFF